MEHTEKIELTTLCLIYDEDRILLQNRVKKDWFGYALPGGHVEQGESIVEGVIREMKEETGLIIYHPKLCGVKQFPIENGRYLVLLFKTNEFEGTLSSSIEGKMEWVERNKLSIINKVPHLDELLRVMEDETLNEFQYIIKNDIWEVELK